MTVVYGRLGVGLSEEQPRLGERMWDGRYVVCRTIEQLSRIDRGGGLR